MTVPGGRFQTVYLHEAPAGNETSDEVIVTGTDGSFTMLVLGVKDLTGSIDVEVRSLDDEWVTCSVTDVSSDIDTFSITADGIYTRLVLGMTAFRTDLVGSGATVKATLAA